MTKQEVMTGEAIRLYVDAATSKIVGMKTHEAIKAYMGVTDKVDSVIGQRGLGSPFIHEVRRSLRTEWL